MKTGAGKIVGAALFVAGVAAIWLWPKPKAETVEETVIRPVRSMEVTGRAALPELRCPGRVRAGESRDMMFEVAGRLVDFKIDRGQRVNKGDVLARLDTRDYEDPPSCIMHYNGKPAADAMHGNVNNDNFSTFQLFNL